MKKIMKKIGKIVAIIFGVILIFLSITTIYHHIMLSVEADKIIPNGKIVDVNGHSMHVYAEGEKGDKPTLVFMSGSGTVAPVYDFKALYTKLSSEYRIVVVERAGYGYSEIYEISRDIDTMLSETRKALEEAGEKGPYVLLPHSISGIEALYWAQQYPNEIAGIIGLDMAVPESYDYFDFERTDSLIKLGHASAWLGLVHIIPGIYPLDTTDLTTEEIQQQKYLMHRNAVNKDYLLEGEIVYDNAQVVAKNELPSTSILLFVSDGIGIGDYWIPCQERFAEENDAKVVYLNCSHYVHNYEYESISEKSKEFLNSLPPFQQFTNLQ